MPVTVNNVQWIRGVEAQLTPILCRGTPTYPAMLLPHGTTISVLTKKSIWGGGVQSPPFDCWMDVFRVKAAILTG